MEVECPSFAYREGLTVKQAAQEDRDFCIEHVNGCLQLKRSHACYWQMQGQLPICWLKWCNFLCGLVTAALWNAFMLILLCAGVASCSPSFKHSTSNMPCLTFVWQPSNLHSVIEVAPARFETLLPEDLCQSRIDGRNGSNACTFIAMRQKCIANGIVVIGRGDVSCHER